MEATITTKGQVTLPKALRDRLKLKAGHKLVFHEGSDGTISILVRRDNLDAVVGILKPQFGKGATVQDLSDAATTGAVEGAGPE